MRRSSLRAVRTGLRRFGAQAQAKPTATKLMINGQFVDASNGATFATVDPRTEEIITEVPEASADDVDAAVQAARHAFDKGPWPRMSGYERGMLMHKLADLIDANASELAALETLDNGKPLFFSTVADVPLTAQHLRYFAGWADKLGGKTLAQQGNMFSYTLHEPIGVAGQIIPWNFPLLMAAWKLGPALATGNCVVLKLSEKTPLTGLRLAQLIKEAGIPDGVVNVLSGSGKVGAAIAAHKGIDKVAFTGSTATALKISKTIAETGRMKPLTSELGGKSPALVFADADIDNAAEKVYFGLFFNHGQCCCASSRVYVHEKVKDEFTEKLLKKVEGHTVGDPFKDGTQQGPLVDKLQFNKVMNYIENGMGVGKVLTGGKRLGDKGYYIAPTVLENMPEDSAPMREEIFGPVMGLSSFSDEADVLARANDTEFGLAAGLFSSNIDTVNRVSRGLKAGTVWVNTYNVFDNNSPFGGYKNSGVGREKGEYALDNYTAVKCVTMPLVGDPSWN